MHALDFNEIEVTLKFYIEIKLLYISVDFHLN